TRSRPDPVGQASSTAHPAALLFGAWAGAAPSTETGASRKRCPHQHDPDEPNGIEALPRPDAELG
ncbi:MAG: hypothetical protein ACHP7G_01075, partial [Actinomycetales bacterium]